MMKKAIITGSTGMIGGLILELCLSDEEISEVLLLNRRPIGIQNKKIREVILEDFSDYSKAAELFSDIDAAFFCLGAYTGKVPDELFRKITVDYAVAFAKMLHEKSPNASLCLLSGAGADRKEKSRYSFAKYKGIAENQIVALGIEKFYCFRPAYIYPVTPRKEPNFMYKAMRFLYPLLRLFGKNMSIRSTDLARAMFEVGLNGGQKQILENRDILNSLIKESK